MSLWDKIITQNNIDTSLLTDLSDISYKSTKGKRENMRNLKEGIVDLGKIPFEVNPPKNKITKEMIEEYHKSQLEPLKDPITGLAIPEKYYPSTFVYEVADLQAPYKPVDFVITGKPADETDLQKIKSYEEQATKDFKIAEKAYYNILNDIKIYENALKSGTHIKTGRPISTALRNAYITKLNQLKTDIKPIEKDIQKYEKEIIDAKEHYKQAEENIYLNKSGENEVELKKKQSLNMYRDSLISRNKKLYMDSQQPNESDEDYLKRMKAVEAEQYDIDLYKQRSELEQNQILKKNLRQLFNKDDLIENIIKSFTPEQQYIINKHFNLIKDYFLDIYGKNNTNLSLKDVVEIITRHLEKILNPDIEYEIEEEDASTAPASPAIQTLEIDDGSGTGKLIPTEFNFGTDNNSLVIENTKEGRHVYFKIGIDPTTKKEILLYSTTENKLGGNFQQVMERKSTGRSPDNVLRNIIDKYLKLDTYAKDKILDKKSSNIGSFINLIKKDTGFNIQPFNKGIKKKEFIDTSGKKYSRYGAGLRDPEQELPEYAYFGNLVIALRKLYYKNILSIKTKSGHSIEGLTNSKVSNPFVDVIIDMYNNKDVSSSIKSLNRDEKNLMNSILYQAGLHKKFSINTNETLQELKNKHKLIEGEILSGNDNPELLKELQQVLLKLYHLGSLSIPSIKKYLKQFE